MLKSKTTIKIHFWEIISQTKRREFATNLMSEISKKQNLIIKKIDPKTINIQINDNQIMMSIVGQFNQNLKELEKLTNTNIFLETR